MGDIDKTREQIITELAELRQRIAELEALKTERKRAGDRAEHLDQVLRVIHIVNQLIVREKNRDRLLEDTCDALVKIRGYYSAWIALLDKPGKLVTAVEVGLGEEFLPMLKRLKRGELTSCGRKAMEQSEVVVTGNPSLACADCPLSDKYYGRGAMAVRLEHSGEVYGLLTVSIPADLAAEWEEQYLIREVAQDIALALHSIELEERRRIAEEQLRFSEAAFRSIQESVVATDTEYTITHWNEVSERIYGVKASEAIGKKYFDVIEIVETSLGETAERIKTLETQGSYQGEELHRTKRTEVWVDVSVQAIEGGGKRHGWVTLATDISERKQVEEKAHEVEALKELDRLRTELLSNVSHELRTPLATIKGYSTMLLDYDQKLGSDEKREYLESIDKASDRLVELIDQLVDMSRLESGLIEMEKAPASISKLVREAVVEAQVRNPQRQLVLDLPKKLPRLKIDAKRIRQVLDNLIDNAVKYSAEGTEVVVLVSVRPAKQELLVSVADQGIGIPAKELPRVFDRMYRTQQRQVTEIAGAGLGLSICRRLIEAHGGRIWMESEEGEGSICFFTLPLDDVEEVYSGSEEA
jgi:PAS domain S-box-containing protein